MKNMIYEIDVFLWNGLGFFFTTGLNNEGIINIECNDLMLNASSMAWK